MGVPTKEGAWITAVKVTRIDCSKCGVVSTSRYPVNDRDLDDLITEHARKHGGIDRG